MDDLSKVGNGDYQPAKKVETDKTTDFLFQLKYLWLMIKSFLQCLPQQIRKFVTHKPKSVEGQLALGKVNH